MKFEAAMKELLSGKKIRRKEWDPLLHLKMIDGKVVAYRGEITFMNEDPEILTSTGWRVVDGDGTSLTFIEGIDELRNKKCLTHDKLGDAFIFVDKDHIAMCKPVEYVFMPTWKCLNSMDWEIMK